MFVLTLGDIFGLIFLAGALVYLVYSLAAAAIYNREDKKLDSKPAPKKSKRQDAEVETKKDVAPKKLSLLECLLAIVMFAAIYFVLHWLLGFWH